MHYYKKTLNILNDTLITYINRDIPPENFSFSVKRMLSFIKKEEDSMAKKEITDKLTSILKSPSLVTLQTEIKPLLEKQLYIEEINLILDSIDDLIGEDATSETSALDIQAIYADIIHMTALDGTHPFFHEAHLINESTNFIYFNDFFKDKLTPLRCSIKPLLESIAFSLNHADYFELIHTLSHFLNQQGNHHCVQTIREVIGAEINESVILQSSEEAEFKVTISNLLSDSTQEINAVLSRIKSLLIDKIIDSSSRASLLWMAQSQNTTSASEDINKAVDNNFYWEELLNNLTQPKTDGVIVPLLEEEKPMVNLWKQRQTERLLGGTKASLKTPAEVLEGLERKSASDLVERIYNKYKPH